MATIRSNHTVRDYPKGRGSHIEQIERWAHFVKENPTTWKKIHTEFINALFDKHDQFRERLVKTPGGREKLARLYGMNVLVEE